MSDGQTHGLNSERAAGATFLDQPVDVLDLSLRARKLMERLRVSTVGDLVGKTEAEVASGPNTGQTTMNEVKRALEKFGLALKPTPGWDVPPPSHSSYLGGSGPRTKWPCVAGCANPVRNKGEACMPCESIGAAAVARRLQAEETLMPTPAATLKAQAAEDEESLALGRAVLALRDLEPEAQTRVASYIYSRFAEER